MSLLDVNDLCVRYHTVPVVDHVSFSIEQGESVGLVGESGSGKSQTALALLGLSPANAIISGSVQIDGSEIVGAVEARLDQIRARRVGIVFQDPMQALNPYLRVGKQLRQILVQHKLAHGSGADLRVISMLERVGLPDPQRQFMAFPHELSGGMRQRVMIASALIAEPDLLIADEPTTALDVTVQAQILDLLEEIRDDTALLLITHDLGIVAGRCERLIVFESGQIVETGATVSVFSTPQHAHTKALLAAAPRIDSDSALVAASGTTVLGIDHAAVSFRARDKSYTHAVVDVSLSLRKAETLAVVGESGSGKSSLVRAVLGLIPMQPGRVVYAGNELQGPVQTRSLAQRRDLQLVFQDPQNALNPQMRVRAIVGEPLQVHERSMSASERYFRVVEMLQRVGLDETFLSRFPHQLSGGQAQRVAIARALILAPKILICDEAVAALDGSVRQQVLDVLKAVQAETGLSIIFISHDLAVVRAISHRVAVMYMGRLLEVARNEALFKAPRHPYTKALIDAVPLPDPQARLKAAPLKGEIPSLLNPPAGCVFHPRCAYAIADCSEQQPTLRDIEGSQVACLRAADIDLTIETSPAG